MSGHSHWATIKHKKGAIDARRGKLWSKLSRALIIAARHGGGDPTMNLKLRYAIDKAREVSMPKENIDRAIKRGTGEIAGQAFEELSYGPVELIDLGDRVLAHVLVSGTGREGIRAEFKFGQLWTLQDGHAVRLDNYGGWKDALEAAGLSE